MGARQTAADNLSLPVAKRCDAESESPARTCVVSEARSDVPLRELARSWAAAETALAQMQVEIGTELRSAGMSTGIADGMARQVSSLLSLLSLREATLGQGRHARKPLGAEADAAGSSTVISWTSGLGAVLRQLGGRTGGERYLPGSEAATTSLAACIATASSLIRRPAGAERRAAPGVPGFDAPGIEAGIRREGGR